MKMKLKMQEKRYWVIGFFYQNISLWMQNGLVNGSLLQTSLITKKNHAMCFTRECKNYAYHSYNLNYSYRWLIFEWMLRLFIKMKFWNFRVYVSALRISIRRFTMYQNLNHNLSVGPRFAVNHRIEFLAATVCELQLLIDIAGT